jgi:hypothetical protein
MGMKNTEEKVALQAVEFWSTVCEEEIELAVELQEVWCFELKIFPVLKIFCLGSGI